MNSQRYCVGRVSLTDSCIPYCLSRNSVKSEHTDVIQIFFNLALPEDIIVPDVHRE